MPLFSVIIPTYNRASFIRKAIFSVLNQNFKDFEIIIVDDGSTDNTKEIVSDIKDDKIIYIKKKNEERAVARNTGIKNAKGTYISFLDSDDYIYENHLMTAFEMIQEYHNPEFFHLGYDIRTPEGSLVNSFNNFNADIKEKLITGNILSCNGVFLRKDIALDNLFNTDRDLSALEDWELWLRISIKYPIYTTNHVTSAIVDHESRSVLQTQKDSLIKRFDALFKYTLKNKIFIESYKKGIKKFKSACYSYIALHLALTQKYKIEVLKYSTKAFLNNPSFIFSRRASAIIKHLFLSNRLNFEKEHPLKKGNFLRRGFFFVLYCIGFGYLIMQINRRKKRVPILVFHRVSPFKDDYTLPLSPKKFKNLLNLISKKYTISPLNDLLNKNSNLVNNCFIVFDDAFKDFYDHALPILKSEKIPVTMFVPVNSINSEKIIWTSLLYNCFKFSKKNNIIYKINNIEYKYELNDEHQRIKAAFVFQNILMTLPVREQEKHLENILNILDYKDDPHIKTMSWEEINNSSDYVNYQSHSMSHPVLSNITDKKEIDYEITESQNTLAKKIKSPVDYFAYPMGKYSPEVVKAVSERYSAGFVMKNQLVDLKKLNDKEYKYVIPRINIYDMSIYEIFFKINGFHNIFKAY